MDSAPNVVGAVIYVIEKPEFEIWQLNDEEFFR